MSDRPAAPACPVCGAALAGRRTDAVYCGPPCRREASRVRRLLAGQADAGYLGLLPYEDRRRRRAKPPLAARVDWEACPPSRRFASDP